MTDVKLSNKTYTFDALEKKYRNFIAPAFKVLIGNRDAVREGMAITNVSVQTSVSDSSDTVTFSISNAYNLVTRDFNWLNNQLKLGRTLEVHMGYTDRLTPLFFGYITNINIQFPEGGTPQLSVTGMDASFKLMRGRDSESYANKSITDIVRDVARAYGIHDFVIDNTSKKLPSYVKKPENDYQFLQKLAQIMNYECFFVGKTLYFRKKNKNKRPIMTLLWGKHLKSFSLDQNLSDQVTQVSVRSWDEDKQSVIEEIATTINKLGTNSSTGVDLLKALGKFEEVLYINAEDKQDAKAKAEAVLNERAMKLVSGEASCIGLPEIRAGLYIELGGLGKRLDQPYYISSATHTIDSSGYTTQFSVQGNAV